MSFKNFFKNQGEKAAGEEILKWDFEKDKENENSEFIDKGFIPIIDLKDNLLKSTFQKKNTFGLYRQLTIESVKNKIIRSKTAISLKTKEIEIVEVLDEKGNTLKINKNLIQKANQDMKNKCKYY